MKLHHLSMLAATWAIAAAVSPAHAANTVEIRRTSYGIPHIKADAERGLGYGIGYTYAEDNVCLLADELVTVRGERSRFFGADARNTAGISNLQSDFFFRWLNREESVDVFWRAQSPEVRELLAGYVSGYNRYLRDAGMNGVHACQGKSWVRPISEADLVKLMRRLLVHGGAWQFLRALINAVPPDITDSKDAQALQSSPPMPAGDGEQHASINGSNAIALGKTLTANGRGLLLGNPHFPWSGGLRFYQMHLTIPEKLDVMGAALPGLPVINIGFNQDVAWTHTLDASSHFTVYRLEVDPNDATRYLVDGGSFPMKKIAITVDVADENGSMTSRSHDFYESRHGVVMSLPGRFAWNKSEAYALRDPNLENYRALQQWYEINLARSLSAFKSAIVNTVGIPWATTVATDADGHALFMNISVIPGLDQTQLASCTLLNAGKPVSVYKDFPVLDGSRKDCEWKDSPGAPQAGILAGRDMPTLERDDFIQNSNDSAWLTQPGAPLTGFPVTVSREGVELNARTRFSIDWLQRNQKILESGFAPPALQQMLMDNEVFGASLILDDLLQLCSTAVFPSSEETRKKAVATTCHAPRQWDRTANLDTGIGYVYFEKVAERARKILNVWTIPFDPSQPLTTPRGFNIGNQAVAEQLTSVLFDVAQDVEREGITPAMKWGDIQQAGSGKRQIPIHGGSGALGVYNVIQSGPSVNGKRSVFGGSSYIQVVWFEEQGPKARTLLTFSGSSNSGSMHSTDQTELFSRKEWVELPFTEAEIKQDPGYRRKILRN